MGTLHALRARHQTFNYRRHETQGTGPAISSQPRLVTSRVSHNGETINVLIRETTAKIGLPFGRNDRETVPVKWIASLDDDGCPNRQSLVYAEPQNDGSYKSVDFRLGLGRSVSTKVINRHGRISFERDTDTLNDGDLRELAGLPRRENQSVKPSARIALQPTHERLSADGLIRPMGSKGLREAWDSAEIERKRLLTLHHFRTRL